MNVMSFPAEYSPEPFVYNNILYAIEEKTLICHHECAMDVCTDERFLKFEFWDFANVVSAFIYTCSVQEINKELRNIEV